MRKYTFNGQEFDSLMEIRESYPYFIFPDDISAKSLWQLGIITREVAEAMPDPRTVRESSIRQIDEETSQKILAGFDYEIDGCILHFSYDTFDQQNFADTANACLLIQAGVEGLPQSVWWNAYKADGSLVRVELTAPQFLELYTKGALAHKQACMMEGSAKKELV